MPSLTSEFHCTNCQDPLPDIRIHCSECTDVDLCVECFSSGAELGPHQNNHPYQLIDTTKCTSILLPSQDGGAWTVHEELLLLEGVEKFGFGNWEDISEHVFTRKPSEVRDEYFTTYLSGCIAEHTLPKRETFSDVINVHVIDDDTSPLSQKAIASLPPLKCSTFESKMLGYMPNRYDFEREYDPAAETIISAMTTTPDSTDGETEIILKLAQIDIYARRLRERGRRKRIVRDHQLIMEFFRTDEVPCIPKKQREFRARFRVFAQYYSAYELERNLSMLERERALRIRLSELFRYRWNGITKFDEMIHFEQHVSVNPKLYTGPYGQDGQTLPLFTNDGKSNGIKGCLRQCKSESSLGLQSRSIVHTIGGKRKRKKRRGGKLKFVRHKIHVIHRRPGILKRIIAQHRLLSF